MSESITVTRETISPERAAALLASSRGNRSLKVVRVRRLTADMRNGAFHMNGETIKIDAAGHLMDGHHRLTALIAARVTLPFLVARGVPADAARTVDAGVARSPADRLRMEGEINVTTIAAALALQLRYENATDAGLPAIGTYRLFGDDVFVALAAHPGMRQAAQNANRLVTCRRLLGPAMIAFCLYHTGANHAFWDQLEHGTNLDNTAPAFVLRERLLAANLSRLRMPEEYKLAITIRAYTAWKERRRIKILRWRTEGSAPEAFPRWPE